MLAPKAGSGQSAGSDGYSPLVLLVSDIGQSRVFGVQHGKNTLGLVAFQQTRA